MAKPSHEQIDTILQWGANAHQNELDGYRQAILDVLGLLTGDRTSDILEQIRTRARDPREPAP